LESSLGATLAHDRIFLSLQSLFQDGVAGNRTVRIESCGFLFFFLREKEEIEPTCNEQDRYADADVRADRRFFLGGDSASTHQSRLNRRLATSVKTEQAADVHYCLYPRSCGAFALLRLAIFDGTPAAAAALCRGYSASRAARRGE